jgi:hypothetical protein
MMGKFVMDGTFVLDSNILGKELSNSDTVVIGM